MIFLHPDSLEFPPVQLAARNDGLLAVGGDLSPERLVAAYSQGIFPWFTEDQPILWWFLSPRLVLRPAAFHLPRRLARTLRSGRFTLRTDTAFEEVIRGCATVEREDGKGTWITNDMIEAYVRLHRRGRAHSLEAWQDGDLAGGLYGVRLGRVFYGESMFTRVRDASKCALAGLAALCLELGISLIDCQMTTAHMQRFGAREISGQEFSRLLSRLVPARELPWPADGSEVLARSEAILRFRAGQAQP